MRAKMSVVVLGVGLLLAAVPSWRTTRSRQNMTRSKAVKLTGTVTQMEWINPHAWIHIDVKKPDGKVESWMVEAGAPNALLRRGFNKQSLLPGTVITVEGLSGQGRRESRQRPRHHLPGRPQAVRRLVGHRRAGRTAGEVDQRNAAIGRSDDRR